MDLSNRSLQSHKTKSCYFPLSSSTENSKTFQTLKMLSKLSCFEDVNINWVVNAHLVDTAIQEICCRQTRVHSELFCKPIKNCTNDQHHSLILVIRCTTLQSSTATLTAFSFRERKEKLCLSWVCVTLMPHPDYFYKPQRQPVWLTHIYKMKI